MIAGCEESQDRKDTQQTQRQQSQYAISQPVPKYDWSLERHMVIKLYDLRNVKAATSAVWRSSTGMIEGHCPSLGFGIPYDTSITNPLKSYKGYRDGAVTEQAEPNGIFLSKNTSATWIMCVGKFGIEPIYTEARVTGYPYPITADYDKNRVTRTGKATVTIDMNKVKVSDVPNAAKQ